MRLGGLGDLAAGTVGDGIVHAGDLAFVDLLHLVQVVGADKTGGVGVVAVHIDQRLEAVLLAAVVQPVDGAFLVDFYMVGVEAVQEIVADDGAGAGALGAEGLGDERKVLFQIILPKSFFNPRHEKAGEVIGEIFFIGDGDDVVGIGGESVVLVGVPVAAGVGKAGLIERIAAKDAAHGVGDQAADVAAKVCAANGDVLILDFGGQSSCKSVDVDEDAVEFFLIGFELGKAVIALALPEQIAQLHRAGGFGALTVVIVRHGCADGGAIPQVMRPLYKRMLGKVP